MSAPTSPAYVLSGWWRRVGAVVLDALVLVIPLIVLALALHKYHVVHYVNVDGASSTSINFNYRWFDTAVWFVYVALLLIRQGSHNGQTIGKQAMGIRVVCDDGQNVGLWTVVMREGIGKATIPVVFILFVPFLTVLFLTVLFFLYWLIDYLWPLLDEQHMALHDMIAGTHVVRVSASLATKQTWTPPNASSPSSAFAGVSSSAVGRQTASAEPMVVPSAASATPPMSPPATMPAAIATAAASMPLISDITAPAFISVARLQLGQVGFLDVSAIALDSSRGCWVDGAVSPAFAPRDDTYVVRIERTSEGLTVTLPAAAAAGVASSDLDGSSFARRGYCPVVGISFK